MNLILLGAPGAGKGTQAELLVKKLSIPAISTGNMLREAMNNGSQLGQQVKKIMEEGSLVPDDVVLDIVAERVSKDDCANGFILDGVPRTLPQAEAMDQAGITFDHVVSIEISDETIETRMSGRRVCQDCGTPFHMTARPPKREGVCDACGGALVQRDDDKLETVRHRLEVYHSETEPLKDYYNAKGILVPVDNQPTIEDTTKVIVEALGI